MYYKVRTAKSIVLEGGGKAEPIASLASFGGTSAHIIVDDHCYVLVHNAATPDGTHRMATHLFPEAFEVLRKLPRPQ